MTGHLPNGWRRNLAVGRESPCLRFFGWVVASVKVDDVVGGSQIQTNAPTPGRALARHVAPQASSLTSMNKMQRRAAPV